MAAKTDLQLTTDAGIIQTETVAHANSATRVGGFLNNINDSKINIDKIDTDITLAAASDTLLASQRAVKQYIADQAIMVDTDVLLAANSDGQVPSQKAIKTYVDAKKAYKSYAALVTNSSGTFTIKQLVNDFTGITFAFTNPSTGVVRATASAAAFTADKSASLGGTLNNAGAVYFINGFAASTTIFTFNIRLNDGTAATTPNFTDLFFEIRVYN